MSENPQDPQPQETEVQQSSAGTQKTDNRVPQDRFTEVVNERNSWKQKYDELQSQQQQQRETELAEQQKYKELYEQKMQEIEALKSAQEQATRYQSALQATNEARIQSIPEDKRSLVPEYDDPVKLGAWLDANIAILQETPKPKAPPLDGGSGQQDSTDGTQKPLNPTQAALADYARQSGFNINSDRLRKLVRNPTTQTDLDNQET